MAFIKKISSDMEAVTSEASVALEWAKEGNEVIEARDGEKKPISKAELELLAKYKGMSF